MGIEESILEQLKVARGNVEKAEARYTEAEQQVCNAINEHYKSRGIVPGDLVQVEHSTDKMCFRGATVDRNRVFVVALSRITKAGVPSSVLQHICCDPSNLLNLTKE